MKSTPHVPSRAAMSGVLAAGVVVAGALSGCRAPSSAPEPFDVVEASIPEMRAAMESGRLTSRQLVMEHLARIARYEWQLTAAVSINPNALEEAEALDSERAAGNVRGPLHGIPVALKDNIHTTHIPTTGGSLAFEGYTPPYEATLTANLREAGAIIIAKAGLTEFANFMAGPPNQMPGNYNALTGYGLNPYDPRRDPREDRNDGRPALTTGGSSSGIGTAASFWAANVGTDTGGSIISPSNANMLVGIRPTIARVSRWGVAPVTLDHDMAGPMARTVTDAAIMLGAMEGAAPDPEDQATGRCEAPPGRDYTPFLNADGLEGARIGIPRAFYYEPVEVGGRSVGGLDEEAAALMAEAVAVLEAEGAIVVDPAQIPSFVDPDPEANFNTWPLCIGGHQAKGSDEGCAVNFKYGMKRDFDAWLASLGPSAPVQTLTELREWNLAHRDAGSMKYEQSRYDISDEMDVEADRARNAADMAKDSLLSQARGIDAVLEEYELDAIFTPGSRGAGLAARAQYPHIVVPFGFVANEPTPPFPEGFDARPAPFGVGFTGSACSEPRLIELAYAFEQATRRRVPPGGFR
ncbi:amidase family protein [Candidatus Palauibacter sp.]|uniref:amidase family protein n=1 Tax=Candidatus Palauibacter sp. TaxID=3101350 RepID=UPI003B5B8BFE